MKALGLNFPLRIEAGEESIRVVDRVGIVAAYVYICDEAERRQQTKRSSREDGIATARIIARALTDQADAIPNDKKPGSASREAGQRFEPDSGG